MNINNMGEAPRKRELSGAAAENALRHKEEIIPNSLFRQFTNLETQVKETQEEYDEIVERGLDPERQQDEQVRQSDIEEGREVKKRLDALQEAKKALEDEVKKKQSGSK